MTEEEYRAPGFDCTVELRSWNALVRLASNGSVGWYQAWAAGEWWSPDPVPLFALFMQHAARLGDTAPERMHVGRECFRLYFYLLLSPVRMSKNFRLLH